MLQLLDLNGNAVQEDVLVDPHHPNIMIPAIAVANLLKIWVNGNAVQCQAAFPNVVLSATLHSTGGNTTVTIPGHGTFRVDKIYSKKYHRWMPERCLSSKRPNRPNEENFWILNPNGKGNVRYVIPTKRNVLARYVPLLNTKLCTNPQNTAIYGYSIR